MAGHPGPSAPDVVGARSCRERHIVNVMELEFAGEIVEWRGPAPFYFVPLPPDEADLIDEVKADVAYWGVIPVTAWLGETSFTTAMFPREETYFLPLKDAVRRAEGVGLGDVVEVRLSVGREG
jgi:hypothetical protein